MPDTSQPISQEKVLGNDIAEFERLLRGTLGRDESHASPNQTSDRAVNTQHLLSILSQAQLKQLAPAQYSGSTLEMIHKEYHHAQDINLRDKNILRFIDAVFHHLLKHTHLDPVITELVQRLQLPITRLALMDHGFLDSPDHPGRLLVDDICYHGIGWYADIGRAGQLYIDTVCDTLSALDHDFDDDPAVIQRLYDDLHEKLEKEHHQRQRLIDRTIATEEGLANIRRADQEAIRFLNRIMSGKALPPEMTGLLQGPWYQLCKTLLIHNSTDSDTWKRLRKLTTNVVWSLLPDTDDRDRQKKMAIIPKLPDFIAEELARHDIDDDDIDRITSTLSATHVMLLKGEEVERVRVTPLTLTGARAQVDLEISQTLIDRARGLETGQWFLFSDESSQTIRVQLALYKPDANYYLFINRAGIKMMDCTEEQVAYFLLNGTLQTIPHYRPFSGAYVALTKQLLKEYEANRLREAHEAEAERRRAEAEARERTEAAEKARREAEALERQRAEARARAEEATRQAEERRRQEEQEKERERLAEQEKRFRKAIDDMALGTWVQIFDEDGHATECNLALKMRSTDKYVFVNRAGIKVAEKKGEALLEMMRAGTFVIIDQDMSDSAIQRLVGTLNRQ